MIVVLARVIRGKCIIPRAPTVFCHASGESDNTTRSMKIAAMYDIVALRAYPADIPQSSFGAKIERISLTRASPNRFR